MQHAIKLIPRMVAAAHDFIRQTRPSDPTVQAALARRWNELPDLVKTPAQLIGRRSSGCEGTHGVFPQGDFSCKPCYHSKDANRVRTDGPHTEGEVAKQMAFLLERRGPGQYAQLIGGEVSLLPPEVHAAALEVMRAHGRIPMSFTHGDFDYDYLKHLALRPDGSRRFEFLSFAAHFDSMMVGRRGLEQPTREEELNPYRARFCAMFDRLEREHGVRSNLAHSMTVSPANIEAVPDVIRNCHKMGFRMFSFQPAAFVGYEGRWKEDFRQMTDEDVWALIEEGAGTRLPYKAIQFGDLRCTRVVWGLYVGDRYVPLLDDEDPEDLAARDLFFEAFPGSFLFAARPIMIARVVRSVARRPRVVPASLRWMRRFVRRAGGVRALRGRVRPMTFVMHNFMDARDVGAAWDLLQKGQVADDERIRSTQKPLQACVYAMAHPETGQIVPACVQH